MKRYSLLLLDIAINDSVINNYWMRLGMISRTIQTEVNVIFRNRRLKWISCVSRIQ